MQCVDCFENILTIILPIASVGGVLRRSVVRVVVEVPVPAAHAAIGGAGGRVHAGSCLRLVIRVGTWWF